MSKAIKAGDYNKKISICKVKRLEDDDGFGIENEVIILKPFAKVKTTKGYTLISSGSNFEKAYTNFTIRYPKVNITRDMYIKYKSKTYTIEYLNNVDENDIELEIQAKEVTK